MSVISDCFCFFQDFVEQFKNFKWKKIHKDYNTNYTLANNTAATLQHEKTNMTFTAQKLADVYNEYVISFIFRKHFNLRPFPEFICSNMVLTLCSPRPLRNHVCHFTLWCLRITFSAGLKTGPVASLLKAQWITHVDAITSVHRRTSTLKNPYDTAGWASIDVHSPICVSSADVQCTCVDACILHAPQRSTYSES